jgi:hypothetical protein
MKTNMKVGTLAACIALSASSLVAQVPDTVSSQSPAIQQNTTTIQQNSTTINQNTAPAPAAPVAPAPAPAPEATATDSDNNDDVLRRGEVGFRYMPTFSTLRLRTYNNETVGGTLTMSHGWGGFIGFNFTRHVGIVGEVNYHEINQKYKDRGLDRQVSVSYLNIPVLLSLNTSKEAAVNLNFVVGPQFGFNIGGSVDGDTDGNVDQARATVGAKSGDVGAAYGAGLEFALNRDHTVRLDLGFRGYYGLVDMRADQTSSGSQDTYNVLLSASRKTYAGYIGIAFLF